jgi:hypothetical protein
VHSRRPPRGVVLNMDSSFSPNPWRAGDERWNGSLLLHLLSPANAQNQGSRWRARASAASLTSSSGPPTGWRSAARRRSAALSFKDNVAALRVDAGHAPGPRRGAGKRRGIKLESIGMIPVHVLDMPGSPSMRASAPRSGRRSKGAIRWTHLSCRSFSANAVRLQVHALAYNLGNFLRTLATREPIKDWSLMSLREKLKDGAKHVRHGRDVAFQMAEFAMQTMIRRDSAADRNCGRHPIQRQLERAGCMSSSENHVRGVPW